MENRERLLQIQKVDKYPRLSQLKREKFLTKRIFQKISENMHYEIFKFENSRDLIRVRAISLGGFQLTTNKLLRSRIGNYLEKLQFNMNECIHPDIEIDLIFELAAKYLSISLLYSL